MQHCASARDGQPCAHWTSLHKLFCSTGWAATSHESRPHAVEIWKLLRLFVQTSLALSTEVRTTWYTSNFLIGSSVDVSISSHSLRQIGSSTNFSNIPCLFFVPSLDKTPSNLSFYLFIWLKCDNVNILSLQNSQRRKLLTCLVWCVNSCCFFWYPVGHDMGTGRIWKDRWHGFFARNWDPKFRLTMSHPSGWRSGREKASWIDREMHL